jgi:RNA polymerase sigma-B factor
MALAQQTVTPDDLVTRHMGLAASLARRFAERGEPMDDLIQVAMVALVGAAKRFEEERGYQFSTYATSCILGELKRHFRDTRWKFHVTRMAKERYLLVRDAVPGLTQDMKRSPTIPEIAERVGLQPEDVVAALELASDVSVRSIEHEPDTGRGLSEELGGSDRGLDDVVDHYGIGAALETLGDRNRRILHLRFWNGMTQVQIAEQLGISQMHVSRLIRQGLDDVRKQLAG